jgi:hypothetical protein
MTGRPADATWRGPGAPGRLRDPLFVRAVLGLYPPRWRDRYGEEFASLLIDMTAASPWPARTRMIANAVSGALDARLNPPGGRTMPDRIRGSIATVACSVLVFAIAGAGFAKMREDPVFAAAAREHAAVGASLDILRVASILAGVAVLAVALPLAWSIIRQAIVARRADLIRPLLIAPAAVACWLIVVLVITRLFRHPRVHSGVNIAAVAGIALLGAAAAVACGWAAVAVLRRADLAPRLLRPQVVPMTVLSACMAVVTGADLSWGLAVRAADGALFHSDRGLVATSLPPNWAGSVLVLAAATAVTVAATMRAAREVRTSARARAGQDQPHAG